MRKLSWAAALFFILTLTGCHHWRHGHGEHCPPGQEKKGNCSYQNGGHCPPGQEKKGRC